MLATEEMKSYQPTWNTWTWPENTDEYLNKTVCNTKGLKEQGSQCVYMSFFSRLGSRCSLQEPDMV